MRRLYNLARGSQVPAALLNGLQDEQLGLIAASDASTGATSVALKGADGRWWTSPDAGIPDGELHVVDASVDWRSRRVWGVLRVLGAAARRPGAADDHIPNDPTAAPNTRTFHGWTGSGGVGAAAATVANGTPPVIADNQYAVLLDEGASTSDRVWLYARPADGVLCVYNDSGATLHAELLVWGAAAEVTAGAVPLVYPSPVYVLWLDPSVAASRPATPEPAEQIALHRATDTGEVTLWDGGAWRSMGMVSPLTTRGDIIVRGASANQRLAVGASGRYLRSDGTDPSWAQVQAADIAGAPWSSVVPPTTVETNDATTTTLATIATIASRSYAVDLVVVSTRSPTDVVAWKLLATVHSDGGGTLTLNDVLVHGPTDGGASTMAATVDVSGTDIRVRVTGLVATVDWSVTGTVLALEN